MKKLNIVLMGAPGAGKGTQSEFITKKYGISHISTGDMLREAMADKTPTGLEAASYINAGKLVPDDVVISIVKERLSKSDCEKGYLLDGFPRTIEQAKALNELTKEIGRPLQIALNLSVDESILISRIISRRVCPKCGASYNLISKKPLKDGICDTCGSALIQRPDDTKEKFKTRLDAYNNQTKPLIEFYKDEGLLVEVDGMQDINLIAEDISKVLEGK